ncbi:ankyrin repeat domain-containing protein SOWAHA-like [Physella acuta]|uniref:ankyrin repeat domain-containing protein SOWAHA-like n=1 Tax=Physella acuta TaxID=109671 RepID=UPI0027DCC38E|nr:ankyrin repeat domain-containing protein SOWAHA-like [Physella acuta]
MGDFEIDAVLQFMLSKGGRVRNHELVTHFKNVLNHPVNKALNREKFKDYVNELASIKLDAGEKVLVLKRKYRPGSMYGDSTNSSSSSSASLSLSNSSSYLSKSSGSKPSFSNTTAASEPNLIPPETSMERPPEQNVSARAQSEPPSASPSDSTDGPMMSKIKDEHMPVNLSKTDRVTEQKKIFEDSVSVSGSNVSLASTESQRSATSSTSGVTSTDDDPNASVISVRDKIKNLNKISSEVDLQQPVGNRKNNKYTKGYKHKYTKRYKHKYPKGVDDDDMSHASGVSYVTLTPEQRDWMVVSAASDYHDMNRLLSKNPSLAKLKTALHWAAKNGKMEVIKLIANKPGVKVNQRSGYTPLHLAAIHDHEYIIELLVQTFKADPNIRDYSGKKAKQYLKNSASSKAQRKRVISVYSSPSYEALNTIVTNSNHAQLKTKAGIRLEISDPIPIDSSSSI